MCRKDYQLVREKSIFVDWQKVKVQELSDEVSYVLPGAPLQSSAASLNSQPAVLRLSQTCTYPSCCRHDVLLDMMIVRLGLRGRMGINLVGVQIPAGSLPRTLEVILRADNVEKVRAGDKVTFIGNPIVVPDVAAISAPGERVQMQPGQKLTSARARTYSCFGARHLEQAGAAFY